MIDLTAASIVECANQECRKPIGFSVNVQGLEFFLPSRESPLLQREFAGMCMACGRAVYWSVSDKIIRSLIRNYVPE
jgi:hypothetical protein